MGTRILEGRDFGTGDIQTSAPVAIVNKTFVDRYLKGRDPIGAQFSAGYPAPDPKNEVTVVGVVDDVRQKSLAEAAEPAYYTPLTRIRSPSRHGGRVHVPIGPRCRGRCRGIRTELEVQPDHGDRLSVRLRNRRRHAATAGGSAWR